MNPVSKVDRPKSTEAFRRAKSLIPGGVNSPARAFGAVGGEPLFIQRAEGPWLFDIDGQKYLDYIGSWGPMILGHCHPLVQSAVVDALSRGSSFGAPTEAESHLAGLVIDAIPSMERVRFVSSGTEATMSALRLARGVTGRDKIIKFAGCYHGHADSLLVAAGSAATTLGVPNSPGVTKGCAQDTLVLPRPWKTPSRRRAPPSPPSLSSRWPATWAWFHLPLISDEPCANSRATMVPC